MLNRLVVTCSIVIVLFFSQFAFGGRYYKAALGRFLSVDQLADKYPAWSPYNYTLNNPLRYIDPDGNDVLDMISRKPLTVEEMTQRTVREMGRMLAANETESGLIDSELNVITTEDNTRNELHQPQAGHQVWWGGDFKAKDFFFWGSYTEGTPRFKVNTWAQLTRDQRASGETTYATVGIGRHHLKKDLLTASFKLTSVNKNGDITGSKILITLTGTLNEINSLLSQTGWEAYKTDTGYLFRRIQKEEDDQEGSEQ